MHVACLLADAMVNFADAAVGNVTEAFKRKAERTAGGKAEGKARDQDQVDETTEAAVAEPEAQQEKDLDGVPWRTWATAMKNGDEEKDEL